MNQSELLQNIRERTQISVIGLGYVGLPWDVEKARAVFDTKNVMKNIQDRYNIEVL